MSDRFQASIRRYHQTVMSNVMGRLQAGAVFALTPQEFTALSDLAGALNYWAAQAPPQTDVQAEIQAGDFARRLYVGSTSVVTAWPFRAPTSGLLYGSASENPSAPGGGDPWLRILTISRTPGDVSPGALVYDRGKQPTCYLQPGIATPGELLYFNTLIDEAATHATGSGFSIVWPAP